MGESGEWNEEMKQLEKGAEKGWKSEGGEP